jgi:hypothetical protein
MVLFSGFGHICYLYIEKYWMENQWLSLCLRVSITRVPESDEALGLMCAHISTLFSAIEYSKDDSENVWISAWGCLNRDVYLCMISFFFCC